MTVFQAIILGILQGLAEFLPISSSAHLTLAPWIMGWDDPGLAFDVALHVGTLIAIFWYFRRTWLDLARAAVEVLATRRARTPMQRRAVFLVLATIPGAIAGLAFEKQADSTLRSPVVIGVALAVVGVVLWVVDRAARQTRELDGMTWKDALLIGVTQMFAIIPGVSRSGATITGGRALGLTREDAAVFSFLMSMPIIAAAAVLKVPDAVHAMGFSAPLLAGVLASAVSGWLAIGFLLRFVQTRSYFAFALYRVLLGVAMLWLVFSRR
ncbi:MAG TPA: undecaprenyl-diphosphatase UppP [Gemmatimonadaceae bacterium]|jgi:undecaprenyl-diphosphatase|nr:undecaprenyl-diphosphatase UppP [Gemmatimonadaceae bacterium]